MGKKDTKGTKPGVMIYTDMVPLILQLKGPQRLAVFDAILNYTIGEPVPEMTREAAVAWLFMKRILDHDDEKYRAVIEKRKKAGEARGKQMQQAAEAKRQQEQMVAFGEHMLSVLSKNSQQTTDNYQQTTDNYQQTTDNYQQTTDNYQLSTDNIQHTTGKERESIAGSASFDFGFVPPSLPQVKEFVFQEGLRFLPEDFVDYYNANGWMIGKQPIQDWKAVARRWSRKEKTYDDSLFPGIDLGKNC